MPTPTRRSAPQFHREPPYSPRRWFARPGVLALTLLAVVTLAVLAAYDGSRLLLTVDEPIQRWVAQHRSDDWTAFFNAVSHLGDNRIVLPLGVLLAAVTFRRCRYLAIAVLLALAVRPGLEFVLKSLIDRARPDIAPLAHFAGPSHPSGHPLAATAFWGLLPPVVALFGAGKKLWWTVTGGVSAIIVLVAMARVYRGAHWATDVTASVLWATLFLLAVEVLYTRFHERFGWHDDADELDARGAAVGGELVDADRTSPS